MKNKKGFTLAEVLITLAIIGVVAAITIPSIIANHQKRELETRLAKSYRTISHAVNMAIAEHGGIESWNWDVMEAEKRFKFAKTYILPHLNIAKLCLGNTNLGCFPDITYKRLNGEDWANVNRRNTTKAILADGTLIAMNATSTCNNGNGNNRCFIIQVDTNGFKKPNTVGYDIHEFSFWPKTGEMLPSGIYHNDSWNDETQSYARITPEESHNYCYNKNDGFYCTAVAIQEGFKINY